MPRDERGARRVAGQPAVAVVVAARVAVEAGGDDERRIGHDQVEPLAGDRFEQRPRAQVPALAGQRAVVAARRSARALMSVATTAPACVPSMQRLHAAAGAEVESARHRGARRRLRQGQRRRADAEHVIGRERAGRTSEPKSETTHHGPSVSVA